jgi:PAS domain-containing protein/signal transduction histidine kinase
MSNAFFYESVAGAWSGVVFGMVYTYEIKKDGSASFPWVSDGIKEIYEVEPEEAKSDAQCVMKRVHPDDVELVKASMGESAKTLTRWACEYRVNLPKAGVRWVRGEAMPEKLDNGTMRWRGQMLDITKEKNAQEHWMQTAKLMNLVADASSKAFFLATPPKKGQKGLGVSYCSVAMADVFGMSPQEAMDNPKSIWRQFSKEQIKKGMDAFYRAQVEGGANVCLEFIDPQGALREIDLSLKWIGNQQGGEVWVGHADERHSSARQDRAWDLFSQMMEQKIGALYLDKFKEAIQEASQASVCDAEWFEEALLWEIDQGKELDWGQGVLKIAVLNKNDRPVGKVELKWSSGIAPQDLAPVFRRAASAASAHWEQTKRAQEIAKDLDEARSSLEKTAGVAAMGSLVAGFAHDLSSPLANGALEIEVVTSRLSKLEAILRQDKIKKSELLTLTSGLSTITASALIEIDKTRKLLESFKKIAAEQNRKGKYKHELGKLLQDMRTSLHPTLRKRGVDLEWVAGPCEIWAHVDVAQAFNWLAKCTTAASNLERGSFAPQARLILRSGYSKGNAYIEVLLAHAEQDQIEQALGVQLQTDASGTKVARFDLGKGEAALGPNGFVG